MQRQTKHNQRKDSFGSAFANRLDLPDCVLPGFLQMLMLANILNPLTPWGRRVLQMAHCVWRAQLLSPPHSCICCCLRRCAQHPPPLRCDCRFFGGAAHGSSACTTVIITPQLLLLLLTGRPQPLLPQRLLLLWLHGCCCRCSSTTWNSRCSWLSCCAPCRSYCHPCCSEGHCCRGGPKERDGSSSGSSGQQQWQQWAAGALWDVAQLRIRRLVSSG